MIARHAAGMRVLAIFAALIVLLGCAAAVMAWPHGDGRLESRARISSADYRHLHPGATLASDLPRLGFDTQNAERLSYLGVMEQFMPRDSFGFDALDPAVQDCFQARDRCLAYIFTLADRPGAKAVVLIEGGRVAYKSLSEKLETSAATRLRAAAN
jgi:hypothetical protein